jgi:hypothetical protein
MPEMPIGSTASSCPEDSLRVFSFMCHPRSEEFRNQYLARVHEQVVAGLQARIEDGKEEFPPLPSVDVNMIAGQSLGMSIAPLGGFATLARAPCAAEVVARFDAQVWPGSLAGSILLFVLQMKESGVSSSINKAVALTAHAVKGVEPFDGIPRGASPRYIRRAWVEFRPVAHLWAAHDAACRSVGPDSPLDGGSEQDFALFLAAAERFAELGLGIYPHGQRLPVLNDSELWRTPKAMRLPQVQIQILPLADWTSPVLEGYRAPRTAR